VAWQFFSKRFRRQARTGVRGGGCHYKISTLEKCEVARASPVKRRNIRDAGNPRRARGNRRAGHARNLVKRQTRGLS
jgi:hypothetical protein